MTVRDPYWSKCICALPFLGPNNGQAFVDLCGGAISVAGNSKHSTAVTKFLASSLYVDGVVDHLKVVNTEFSWGSSNFTICGWAYLSAYSGTANTLFNIGDGVGTNELLVRVSSNGKLFAGIYHGAAYQFQINGTTVIPLGSWFHIAFVRSGDNHYVFLNGVLEMSAVKSHSLPALVWNAYFGGLTETGYDQYRHNGYLSEFRIYKTAIGTPTTFPVPTGALGNGDPSWDSVIFHLQAQNNSESKGGVITNVNGSVSNARGHFLPNSMYLNGTSAYLTADWVSALVVNNVTFSMEGWFFQETVQAGINVAFGFHDSAGNNRFVVCNDYIFGNTGNTINESSFPEKLFNLGAWTYVMAVHDNGIITVFKNGSPLASYAGQTTNIASTDKFSIGQDWDAGSPSDFFKGNVNDVRISLGARQPVGFFRIEKQFGDTLAYDSNIGSVSILLHGDGNDGEINTPIVDSSGNNLSTTITGIVAQGAFSPFPPSTSIGYNPDTNIGSIWTDGAGGYFSIQNPGAITGNFTLEFWFNPISYVQSETNIFEMGLYTDGILLRNSSGIWINGPNTAGNLGLPLSAWSHLAVVRVGSTVFIYKNGNLVYTASNGGTLNAANGPITFGTANHSTGQVVRAFVSDIHFINGAAKYTGNFVPPTGPVPLYNNGEFQSRFLIRGNTAKIKDVTGKSNVVLSGTAKISSARGVFFPTSIFCGNGSFSWPFNSNDFNFNGDFTIECFFYTSTNTGDQPLYTCNSSNGSSSLYFALRGSGVEVDAQGTTALMNTVGSGTWKLNQWNHIALVRIGSSMSLWVNKCRVTTISNSTNFTQPGATYCSCNIPGGYIAEYRITKGIGRYNIPVTLSPPLFTVPNKHLMQIEPKVVSGSVLVPGGVSNKIRAYTRAKGELVAETFSDPITGVFSMDVSSSEDHTVLCLDENRNALVFDRVVPV